ncbi:MAG: hypothetical protein KUG49_01295, partial [Dokdonia sp.]|nr:hypothetical protein [Dokdonia sp.]
YRYFIKKGNEVTALENTKVDGKYQAEYLGTLQALTKDAKTDTNRLRLTLGVYESLSMTIIRK